MAQKVRRLLRKVPGLYTFRPIDGRSDLPRGRRMVAAGAAAALVVGAAVMIANPNIVRTHISLTAGGDIVLKGHGNGHGRGMGQYGALGYAKKGWNATQIVSHFYGGTTPGNASNQTVTVTLTGQHAANVYSSAPMKVGPVTTAPGQAVSINGNTATITSGCGGGGGQTVAAHEVSPVNPAPNLPADQLLKFCGSNAAYRGSIGMVNGKVTNTVQIDDYVRGVVPKESIPNWADQGGAATLQAQAIVARSYALASVKRGKPVDDTQNSQVYGGVAGEDPRTNAAVQETAGQILLKDGQPAFTEFSSSTGGYTDGRDFPAVVDDGDTISPFHNWTATIPASAVASAFGLGSLTSMTVTQANGLGAENGRAIQVTLVGGGQTVQAKADDVRTKLGLKSSWFAVEGQTTKPQIIAPQAGVGAANPMTGLAQSIPGLGSLAGGSDPITSILQTALGAIGGKYTDLGGATGVLGDAIGPVISLLQGQAAMQQYKNGNIYYSPATGAQALTGVSLQSFIAQGAQAVLGLPTRDSLGTPAGAQVPGQPLIAPFQNGTLSIDPTTGASTRTG
jgi:SpoIID/LytB domain protein